MKRGRFLEDVWDSVKAAHVLGDQHGVLKWEGSILDELLEHLTEHADCELLLKAYLAANTRSTNSQPTHRERHAETEIAEIRLRERHAELLGKMELFRDQGEEICQCGTICASNGQRQHAEVYFRKARDIGAAHGLFLLESKACTGLGESAASEGRHEEGLELLRNSVVAARLSESDELKHEMLALLPLIAMLFEASAIGEVEPLVLRFREVSFRIDIRMDSIGDIMCELHALFFNARLHEVL